MTKRARAQQEFQLCSTSVQTNSDDWRRVHSFSKGIASHIATLHACGGTGLAGSVTGRHRRMRPSSDHLASNFKPPQIRHERRDLGTPRGWVNGRARQDARSVEGRSLGALGRESCPSREEQVRNAAYDDRRTTTTPRTLTNNDAAHARLRRKA